MSGGPASAGAGTAPPFAAAARDLAARRALAIGGVVPEAVATPATRAALVECVREAGDAGAALVPLGLGAHRDLGHAPARYDLALSTRELAAIVDYAPADMTVTVESGVTLAALDVLLTSHGQWLPLDPPLPARTTVGGLLAADLSGPLRASQGRVRDYVLGIAMVTADGRETRAGGRVVKNVAGYDLMKLMVGSLGTLAVITEATLKVRPRPEVTRVIELALADRDAALALAPRLAALGEVALAIGMLVAPELPRPTWRCSLGGVAADVAAVHARLLLEARAAGAVVVHDDDGAAAASTALLAAARDLPCTSGGELAIRAAVLRDRVPAFAAEILACAGADGVRARVDPRAATVTLAIETGDAAGMLARLRAVASHHRATLVVTRWPEALAATIDVWSPLPSALPLMRRIKEALDPAATLAPGRFVARL